MAIKRIIFLTRTTFNYRDFQRFGVELLQQSGFTIEFWDTTPVLDPATYRQYQPPDPYKFDGLRVFYEKDVLLKEISNLASDTFVIDTVHFEYKNLDFYQALSKSKAEYAVIMANALPVASLQNRKYSLVSILQRKTKTFLKNPKEVLWRKKILPHLPIRLFGVKPAKIILAGGEKSLTYHFPVNRNTEILWIHSFDYDLYLEKAENKLIDSTTAVFLDEYLPFHPDDLSNPKFFKIDPMKYYTCLNSFFDRIERELSLKVIIAAHPKALYENMPNIFHGRRCIRGQTIGLVKTCRLVLTHASTAISFAVLLNKPLVFINSTGLDKSPTDMLIRTMANYFGKAPIFMDSTNKIDWEQQLMINLELYKKYRREYIKTEQSPDLYFWQIVANRLKQL